MARVTVREVIRWCSAGEAAVLARESGLAPGGRCSGCAGTAFEAAEMPADDHPHLGIQVVPRCSSCGLAAIPDEMRCDPPMLVPRSVAEFTDPVRTDSEAISYVGAAESELATSEVEAEAVPEGWAVHCHGARGTRSVVVTSGGAITATAPEGDRSRNAQGRTGEPGGVRR